MATLTLMKNAPCCALCERPLEGPSMLYECDRCDSLLHEKCLEGLGPYYSRACPSCGTENHFIRREYEGYPICKYCNRDIKPGEQVKHCDCRGCDRVLHLECWRYGRSRGCPICGALSKDLIRRFDGWGMPLAQIDRESSVCEKAQGIGTSIKLINDEPSEAHLRIMTESIRKLSELLDKPGHILSSSIRSIKPGLVYLLGQQPQAASDRPAGETIRDHASCLRERTSNDYIDRKWLGYKKGGSPLQKRVIWMLRQMGLKPRNVAASNLIFFRFQRLSQRDYFSFAEKCWPVHESILSIVQPKMVLTYGNAACSPYAFLRRRADAREESRLDAGHAKWSCKAFTIPGQFKVVGLPHIGSYSIDEHPEVIGWIIKLLEFDTV